MSKALNIETVAEGIENREQFELLRDFGCDYVQGFYFSMPKPLDEVIKFIKGDKYEEC